MSLASPSSWSFKIGMFCSTPCGVRILSMWLSSRKSDRVSTSLGDERTRGNVDIRRRLFLVSSKNGHSFMRCQDSSLALALSQKRHLPLRATPVRDIWYLRKACPVSTWITKHSLSLVSPVRARLALWETDGANFLVCLHSLCDSHSPFQCSSMELEIQLLNIFKGISTSPCALNLRTTVHEGWVRIPEIML